MKEKINLKILQAKELRRARFEDLGLNFKITGPIGPKENQMMIDFITKFDEYMEIFLPPGPCINCGLAQGDFLGYFTWGIQHGEGYCSNCGYPARAYHYIKDEQFPLNKNPLNIVLQYHPMELKQRGQK